MRTKSPSDPIVKVHTVIRAPIDRVYEAWTDPKLLRQWWGPEGVTTHELDFDPKVEGRWRWALSDSKGKRMAVHGWFTEVVGREKLGFTWAPGEGASHAHEGLVTVDFREMRGVEVRVFHAGLPDQQSHDEHEEGWKSALAKLKTLLEGGRRAEEQPARPHRAAYRETEIVMGRRHVRTKA